MVDAHALGACGASRAGSNPASPTTLPSLLFLPTTCVEMSFSYMEEIECAFTRTFASWDIQLPAEAVSTRKHGKLAKAGWFIEYRFGYEGDTEYLDYYAAHRMTSDSHVRIHHDGHSECLEAPRESYSYPTGADEAVKRQAWEEFNSYNRAVYEKLRRKGFLSDWDDNQS